jgi:protein involved in polysaccharide export with SLBB domain
MAAKAIGSGVLNTMRQKLVLSLSMFFVVFSPLAMAQNSSSSEYPSDQSTPTVDCSDPLLANSGECQTNEQNGSNPSNTTQQYSPQGPTQQINPGPIPQANMNRPQTYNDTGNQTYQQNQYNNLLNQKPLPPQPLTEFQKFVAGTTGQVLPVFGASLFQNAPSTFAPVDQAPVPPDYVIGPGDELRIRIWGQVNFNANVFVDRAGEIYLPQVGQVHVAGLPYQALSDHLHAAVARVFHNFDLTADIGQIRSLQVYVVGQAHRPGTYTVSSLSTLVDAIFASGGPSVEGSMRHIYLKRNQTTVVDFDLYDLLVNGDKSRDAKLQSGDVIFIPPAGPQVALAGAVRRPAIYELLDSQTTIGQLLKDAGGPSTTASDSRISVERIENRQSRAAMEVGFDPQGLATVLQQGDILRVLSIVPMYQKTVTLRGNLANPGRFAWHQGMRLSDLIPDRESLLTRDYWWKRAQLGLPSPEFEPVPMLAAQSQPSYPIDLRTRAKNFPLNPAECRAYNSAYDSNWYRCNPYGQNGVGNQHPYQTNNQQNSNGQYNPNAPPQYNPNTQYNQSPYEQFPGANQQDLTGTDQGQTSQQQQGLSGQTTLSGTLAARQGQVITENTAGATQHTRVALSAPEIDWDYAVIERLDPNTLKTSLIPFDLGKLVMDHDPSQNLEIQPGDVVSIFSQADIHVPVSQQTKFVRLEGEFVHAGTYSTKPGETLPELIARAGGFTPSAYLYGSEFTRESTRVIQQQRIDEYVQNLQLEINRGTLAQTSSAGASATDVTGASAAVASENELIYRLQQIRATGRIVLEERPGSAGVSAVPAITLEDGDSFTVPSRPASVNVVGSVYDQNSFLFVPGRRVGDYLHLAGGPNRDADRKHAFVIRADGSVVSRVAANGVWGNTFDAMRISPGDTIVVPEKVYGFSAMRSFLEWSQLFSQLALGVAAVSIIE